MTGDRSAARSSISRTTRSSSSRRSRRASSTSTSPGSRSPGGSGRPAPPTGLTRRAVRDLAERHGIRPTKSLGQNFLVDPNLARRIAALAGVGRGDRVVEVGAGVGSLTVSLAATGARVLALEFDRRCIPALEEAVAPFGAGVDVVSEDATQVDWRSLLGRRRWTMVSNLPYNVGTSLVVGMLEQRLPIDRYLVMVQREVGERLAAGPGEEQYGAVSVRVAYFAEAKVLRRVPKTVFWPEPRVESVLVELVARRKPPVRVDEEALFRVVNEGFAQRRKTMRSALRRLGAVDPEAVLTPADVEPSARPEELSLEAFARIAEELG